MKRKLSSVLITLCLLLALLPTTVFAAPEFSTEDIAVINAIIENNRPTGMTASTDGTSVPADWEGKVCWSDATPKRVESLIVRDKSMTGTLDVSGLTALKELICYGNELTGIDVRNQTSLIYLDCSRNKLTGIDLSGLADLIQLYCNNNELTGLNVSGLTSLETLICYQNKLTGTLDVSGLTALKELICSGNELTDLNVSGLTALKELICFNNELTGTLDVSGLTTLERLNCYENQLTGIDMSGLTALKILSCHKNQLTGTFDVSGLTVLQYLKCSDNQLTGINVSGLADLEELICFNNELTEIKLNDTAPYQNIIVNDNYLPSESAITGREITWDGTNFIFAPQKASGSVKLATPTGLCWGADDDAIFAEWEKVDGVKYSVEVFKDGTSVFQSPEPVNRRFIEVTSVLISSGNGTYTFRVKALGDGVATTDSDWSDMSPERAYTEETAPPEETESPEETTPKDAGEALPVTGENLGSYLWLSLLPLLIGGLMLALRKERLSKQKD